jgi:inner membrane transporter RhtA
MLNRASPISLVLAAAFVFQLGAAVATTLFDRAGPLGTVLLRVGWGAVILLVLHRRALADARGRPLRWVILFGLVLATMNALFYQSLDRIPLGVAVTVEFIGPLAVAVALSRRPLDLAWIALAGAGVALLGSPTVDVDGVGLLFALGAGACWAAYIVVGKRMAATVPLRTALAVSMTVAAIVILPFGLADAAGRLADPVVLAAGLAVALLSSVLPYTLELTALRRMRASTFSIVLSLEPAIAALVGAVLLSQQPSPLEALAVVLVVAASIGASRGVREVPVPEA